MVSLFSQNVHKRQSIAILPWWGLRMSFMSLQSDLPTTFIILVPCCNISMVQCMKDVTPVHWQWSYVFLALTHWYHVIGSVGNYHRSAGPRPTTLDEDRDQFFYNFMFIIWDSWHEDLKLFFTEFQTWVIGRFNSICTKLKSLSKIYFSLMRNNVWTLGNTLYLHSFWLIYMCAVNLKL